MYMGKALKLIAQNARQRGDLGFLELKIAHFKVTGLRFSNFPLKIEILGQSSDNLVAKTPPFEVQNVILEAKIEDLELRRAFWRLKSSDLKLSKPFWRPEFNINQHKK